MAGSGLWPGALLPPAQGHLLPKTCLITVALPGHGAQEDVWEVQWQSLMNFYLRDLMLTRLTGFIFASYALCLYWVKNNRILLAALHWLQFYISTCSCYGLGCLCKEEEPGLLCQDVWGQEAETKNFCFLFHVLKQHLQLTIFKFFYSRGWWIGWMGTWATWSSGWLCLSCNWVIFKFPSNPTFFVILWFCMRTTELWY